MDKLFEASLPSWLFEPIIPRIQTIQKEVNDIDNNIFTFSPHGAPNHVLVNEYVPGQGIMPHKDGPAYYPVVCTVSLGSSICLDIYDNNSDGTRKAHPQWRILQEPRSLLITTDYLYADYLHGIAEITTDLHLSHTTVANWSLLRSPEKLAGGNNDRQTRTSLTFRDVIKVLKLGNKFGLLGIQ